MKYRRLLMSVVCFIGVLTFIGQANALNWYGFSQLCFEGEFKGTKDSNLEVTLVDVTVFAQCYNINNPGTCQPGVGNAGDITIKVDALADPEKIKGTLNANVIYRFASINKSFYHKLIRCNIIEILFFTGEK